MNPDEILVIPGCLHVCVHGLLGMTPDTENSQVAVCAIVLPPIGVVNMQKPARRGLARGISACLASIFPNPLGSTRDLRPIRRIVIEWACVRIVGRAHGQQIARESGEELNEPELCYAHQPGLALEVEAEIAPFQRGQAVLAYIKSHQL
jgi:hypothetical protein